RMMRPKGGDETYLDGEVELEGVELAELIRRLPDDPAVEDLKKLDLSGKLSLRVRFGVPINTPSDFCGYHVAGEAAVETLTAVGRQVRLLRTTIDYRDGLLRLARLGGEAGRGSFDGRAAVRLLPAGEVWLELDADRLP